MTDDSTKETLGSLADGQPKKEADGTVAAEGTDQLMPKQESDSKEVNRSESPLKAVNWKDYFVEFIMIFLAVALGFMADNLRENLADRTKEKQYIEGFIHNLKEDTIRLQQVIESDRQQAKGIDSLLRLAHADLRIDTNRRLFYYYISKYCYNSALFTSNDATLQQLKSTGDYRLIEKGSVADSLAKQDSDVQNIYKQGADYADYFKEIVSRLDELTDMTVFLDTSYVKEGKFMHKPFPQLRAEKGELTTFFNKLFIFKVVTDIYVEAYLKPHLANSKRRIVFLKQTYALQK